MREIDCDMMAEFEKLLKVAVEEQSVERKVTDDGVVFTMTFKKEGSERMREAFALAASSRV